jgi:mannose-6-phosphate isomerase-like protein (cupin superfamily)
MASLISWDDLDGKSPTHFSLEGKGHDVSVCIIVVDFEPGAGPKLHRHPYEEIFVVHEGRATFFAGDETIEATVGQVVAVPAGTPHRFVNSGPGRLRLQSVHAQPAFATEWLEG